MSTTKIMINSTISTPGAKFMTMDLRDFYCGTPMEYYEYIRILLYSIPQEIIDQYELVSIEENSWIFIEIHKGMSVLKQAGKLSMTAFKKNGKTWLWNNVLHPWAVETCLSRHLLHTCNVWFQDEVHKQAICAANQKFPANIIPCDHILDKIKKKLLTLKWY